MFKTTAALALSVYTVSSWKLDSSTTYRSGSLFLTNEIAGIPILPVSDLRIRGRHNYSNVLAALALGSAINIPEEYMVCELRTFTGLPHRCELVGVYDGVEWINDSKGTNVGATVAALNGFEGSGKIILIAGGDGKGADFSPLAAAVKRNVRGVILIGRDAQVIAEALGGNIPSYLARDLKEAVINARKLANDGDVILLSPACASYDMFSGFEERGEVFTKEVMEIFST